MLKIRKLAYRAKAMRTIRVVMVLSRGVSMEVDALNWKDDTDVQDSESKINPLCCLESNNFFGVGVFSSGSLALDAFYQLAVSVPS